MIARRVCSLRATLSSPLGTYESAEARSPGLICITRRNLQPLFAAVWPACWKTHTECNVRESARCPGKSHWSSIAYASPSGL